MISTQAKQQTFNQQSLEKTSASPREGVSEHGAKQHGHFKPFLLPEDPMDKELVSPETKRVQWSIKRLVDILASGTGLLALSPLLMFVAMLIKLDSPGPVLIRQKRVGHLGREFYMYKFRTMIPNADRYLETLMKDNETSELMFKMKRDPRITRVGRWFRKYSVDELPQLWNVLRGEMSLVGPRPPLPNEVSQYRRSYLQRLATVPGLTGYWQISGRADIRSFQQVVNLDVQYIREWSLWTDLRVLLKTVPVVLMAKGAS